MKITVGGRAWGSSFGAELLGIGMMIGAFNAVVPMNISQGIIVFWAGLTGLLLFLGV